jgi:ATP-dependent DNA ligase
MLAKTAPALPDGAGWFFDPKWDGFRCTIFLDRRQLLLQSRDLKPLGRYFPELETGVRAALPKALVLDGEVVIATEHGLDFGALQMRIHPAESRVRMLAGLVPASFVAFDLLAEGEEDLRPRPAGERRDRLEAALRGVDRPVHLTPSTRDRDRAVDWFERFEGAGLDGVIAKRLDEPYKPGERGWLKIKHLRTVDCVLAGYRWQKGEEGRAVGSLLLGLYDAEGILHYVGHTSSFSMPQKRELVAVLAPYVTDGDEGFGGGRTPGEPSRWTGGRDTSWVRLRPELVCEVTFDHMQGDRFRHAATFQRWRFDKPPNACAFDQIRLTPPVELAQVFGA